MLEAILAFLGISLLFYCLFAGADFGAGILELFPLESQPKASKIIAKGMGPVWEANHIWLILGVVILFMGFPRAFYLLSVHFHIPLVLMLVGITLRGCAFAFRHYDAFKDESQHYYARTFAISSLFTPWTLGLVAGGLISGRMDIEAANYADAYIFPWLNAFSIVLGLFVSALFTFTAAAFLIGETRDTHLQDFFAKRAQQANLISIGFGLLIFLLGTVGKVSLIQSFLESWRSLVCVAAATALIPVIWNALKKRRAGLTRFLVGVQMTLILLGWFAVQFPYMVQTSTGGITYEELAAPVSTQKQLLWALVVGSLLILPALGYLLKTFKTEK